MSDDATPQGVLFKDLCGKALHAQFDQPDSSSDGGAILLKACDRKLGLIDPISACLRDRRDPQRVVHGLRQLVEQRVYGIACGYEDCNDAARLRKDPIHRLLLDSDPQRSAGLASQPTLSRFENAIDARSLMRMGNVLSDRVIERHRKRLRGRVRRVTIDLDPTDDPTYGSQQLALFNGHYRNWCYLPVACFVQFGEEADQYLIGYVLRSGEAAATDGATAILRRVIGRLRRAFAKVIVRVRLDGGFATPEVFEFLDDQRVEYAVAIGKNPILEAHAEPLMKQVRRRSRLSGESEQLYGECDYGAQSWDTDRRVIFKAEVVRLPGRNARDNPRFVVTNIPRVAKSIYEHIYCRRALIENRIKELHYGLAIDRTSCSRFLANQFRVLLTAVAYVLLQELRLSAKHTSMAGAQVTTLRERVLKLAVWVQASTRRLVLHLPQSAPWRSDWCRIARALGATPI